MQSIRSVPAWKYDIYMYIYIYVQTCNVHVALPLGNMIYIYIYVCVYVCNLSLDMYVLSSISRWRLKLSTSGSATPSCNPKKRGLTVIKHKWISYKRTDGGKRVVTTSPHLFQMQMSRMSSAAYSSGRSTADQVADVPWLRRHPTQRSTPHMCHTR